MYNQSDKTGVRNMFGESPCIPSSAALIDDRTAILDGMWTIIDYYTVSVVICLSRCSA